MSDQERKWINLRILSKLLGGIVYSDNTIQGKVEVGGLRGGD